MGSNACNIMINYVYICLYHLWSRIFIGTLSIILYPFEGNPPMTIKCRMKIFILSKTSKAAMLYKGMDNFIPHFMVVMIVIHAWINVYPSKSDANKNKYRSVTKIITHTLQICPWWRQDSTHCGRVTQNGGGSMLCKNPIFFTLKVIPQI